MSSAYTYLDRIDRIRLGILPTPLTPAKRLAQAIGVSDLWIKHDELIGFGFGGNKVRGLEFLLADAKCQGADTLITGAGPQSNHVRATAAAAAWAGMESLAVYWGDEPNVVQGNLRLVRMLGMQTRFTHDTDRTSVDAGIDRAADELRRNGRNPYSIPRGGACAIGVLGHIWAARELAIQCAAMGLRPDRIVLAVGSGATMAGWLLGTSFLGAPWRVEGVTVSRPAHEVRARILALASEAATLLGQASPIDEVDIVVHDGFIGEGYGIPTLQGSAAMALVARLQGNFLDPTYTAKAFAGLQSMAAAKGYRDASQVVFIHTGGEPALFADPLRKIA